MIFPDAPVTLTPEQIVQLNQCLSQMRHDINNSLTVLTGFGELIRLRPEAAGKYAEQMVSHPQRIAEKIRQFSAEWEVLAGIKRE